MALTDGYLFHVVARLGVETDIPAMIMGEFGFDTDTQTLRIGNDTARPVKIPSDRSTGEFDFTRSAKFTLPGSIVFDASKPGQVNGITLSKFNQANGLLVRRGDNDFGSTTIRSSDQSLIVVGGSGTQSTIDLRINPDSDLIQNLFDGIGVLNISSIQGLQQALDDLYALIAATATNILNTIRGGVSADYDTLKKLYDFVNANVIVVGDPSGVVAQVLAIIRDGVRDDRNTLRKISDDLDALQTQVQDIQDAVDTIGIGGGYYDQYFINIALDQSSTSRILMEITDRINKENGHYADAIQVANSLMTAA